MSDVNTSTTDLQSDDRATWATPEVVIMAAGAAENAAGPRADDPVNFS